MEAVFTRTSIGNCHRSSGLWTYNITTIW